MPEVKFELHGFKRLRSFFLFGAVHVARETRATLVDAIEIYRDEVERRVRQVTTRRSGELHDKVRAAVVSVRPIESTAEVFFPSDIFYGHILNVGAQAHQGVRTTGGATRRRKRGHPALPALHFVEDAVAAREDDVGQLFDTQVGGPF